MFKLSSGKKKNYIFKGNGDKEEITLQVVWNVETTTESGEQPVAHVAVVEVAHHQSGQLEEGLSGVARRKNHGSSHELN